MVKLLPGLVTKRVVIKRTFSFLALKLSTKEVNSKCLLVNVILIGCVDFRLFISALINSAKTHSFCDCKDKVEDLNDNLLQDVDTWFDT